MIHSKQTYVKNNKKLLRKVHSKWTVVSVALLSMIGLGGLSVHQANADSVHVNQDPNIVTSWTPKVANIQSQKAVTNASQNSSNISSAKTANFGATGEQSQTQLNTNDSSENSLNSQNQAQKPATAQIPKNNLGQQPKEKLYPFNVQVNTYDKNTNDLLDSHLYHEMRPNGYTSHYGHLIKTESQDLHFTVPSGTNTSIQLNYGSGSNTTDPNTGFTKQPANTTDIALPGSGWHDYAYSPFRTAVGTSMLVTGDFTNYKPLYDLGEVKDILQNMGVSTSDIFPNVHATNITGIFGNRLPEPSNDQFVSEAKKYANNEENEFKAIPLQTQQQDNNSFLDPNKYTKKTLYRNETIHSTLEMVQNQERLEDMFPDLKDLADSIPDIAVRVRVINHESVPYLNNLFNDIKSLAQSINTIYLGNATNLTTMQDMFSEMPRLKSIQQIGNFDTGQVNNMADAFSHCHNLTNINGLSHFNTSNVTDMNQLFMSDPQLSNIEPLKFWNTHNVYEMTNMFSSFSNLPGKLSNLKPLAHWDTSNVLSTGGMFAFQPNITDISPLANWKLSDYIYSLKGMFVGDLNISNHPNWTPNNAQWQPTEWFYYYKNDPSVQKKPLQISYPIAKQQQLFNAYINDPKRVAPIYKNLYKLSFNSGITPSAHQLRSPNRKQDTDYVNFYANGEPLGVAKVHGLDESNLDVSPLGGYMLDPNTHFLFNNGQHRMNLIPLNSSANNLETLNVPVSLDATAPSNTPSHNATPANSNNTPTNHQSPDDNTGNSSRRQGADNENNGSDSQDHNTGNSHTAGVNNNNNERRGNAAGGGAGGDSNNNPSNNIAGGNHGNVVNNNDHGNQGNHSNYGNATAEAFAGTVDEHDRNDNQLIDMTDNDMNAALARQQNQEDQNQNYWVNEFKDVDNLAALIQQQHVEDENQAQIRQFNFDQKMAALQKQVTTSFTNPLNQMMNSLN